jgi:glucokinase
MILAGDVGGTKTVVGLFEDTPNGCRLVREDKFVNSEFSGLDEVLARFVSADERPRLTGASFGIAGPVIDGRVEMTNLAWSMDESDLARGLGVPRVRLLNDLQAMALGMIDHAPEQLTQLSGDTATRRRGNAGLIAAGTGLGEALLCWDGEQYHPLASEGGHADFAPTDDLGIELLRYLQQALGGHVSYEFILSGRGIVNIYNFLRDTGREEEPDALRARLAADDPAGTITAAGMANEFPICTRTLDVFVGIYGAEAGNLALRGLTIAGLYVGGGIAPRILAKLTDGRFMRSFCDKANHTEMLASMPVNVSLIGGRAAMLGAASYARRLGR